MSGRDLKSAQRPPNDDSYDTVQRQLRRVANQQRSSAPPRCHPISIYILVQACGCIFTGLTMIITANWPGTGSKSSNILKIFGPILLAMGFILLLIGILLARFLRKKEAKRWEANVSKQILSASRQIIDQSIPTYQGPSLKQQYACATEEERRELIESPENFQSELKKKDTYSISDIEMLNSSSSAFPQSPVNNDDVPDPIRITKPKKKTGTSSSSMENLQSSRNDDESVLMEEQFQKGEFKKYSKRTVKTTTVVTQRTTEGEDIPRKQTKRPKPPPVPQKPASSVQDSPRLIVKVKASPGTSVNIRHSGSGQEDYDDSRQEEPKVHKKPKIQTKPKAKTKPNQEVHGTDI